MWHSVIRGLVTYRLMVRREPCDLIAWITDVPQKLFADDSNLTVIAAPSRCCQICTLISIVTGIAVFCRFPLNCPLTSWTAGCHRTCRASGAKHPCQADVQDVIHATFVPSSLGVILFVISPQMKQASSLATAATATLSFFPWRIIR